METPKMEMPRPADAHRKLERLAGRWTGEERIFPSPFDPAGGTAIGRVENRIALDGFIVVQDYEQERNGVITFRGHGVFSYDANEKCYVMTWWDSMGMAANIFRGSFENNILTLTNTEPQGQSRASFDVSEDGVYKFRMEVSQDGTQWFPFMEGRYTRA